MSAKTLVADLEEMAALLVPCRTKDLLERAIAELKRREWQAIELAPTDKRVLIFADGNQFVASRKIGGWWKTHVNTPEGALIPSHFQELPEQTT